MRIVNTIKKTLYSVLSNGFRDGSDYGAFGRLIIPSLNISVPLYTTDKEKNAQEIVDDEDSALYLKWPYQYVIVDHARGTFKNLYNAIPGKTIAIIDKILKQERYICVKEQRGMLLEKSDSRENILYDANGKRVQDSMENKGGLCIYTCMEALSPNTTAIKITYWKRIK